MTSIWFRACGRPERCSPGSSPIGTRFVQCVAQGLPMRRMLLILACSLAAVAQNAPDPALYADIQKIPAIDNHTHVMKVTAAGEKDTEFDALPCEVEPWDLPVFLRPDRPEVVQAWKALYGYQYNDQSPEHVKELIAARAKVMQEQGDDFANWVLGRIH